MFDAQVIRGDKGSQTFPSAVSCAGIVRFVVFRVRNSITVEAHRIRAIFQEKLNGDWFSHASTRRLIQREGDLPEHIFFRVRHAFAAEPKDTAFVGCFGHAMADR